VLAQELDWEANDESRDRRRIDCVTESAVHGAAFLVAPDKANEWFGIWSSQNSGPLQRRVGGLVWIVLILFIALVVVGALWK
jgi:hypothetical protein